MRLRLRLEFRVSTRVGPGWGRTITTAIATTLVRGASLPGMDARGRDESCKSWSVKCRLSRWSTLTCRCSERVAESMSGADVAVIADSHAGAASRWRRSRRRHASWRASTATPGTMLSRSVRYSLAAALVCKWWASSSQTAVWPIEPFRSMLARWGDWASAIAGARIVAIHARSRR